MTVIMRRMLSRTIKFGVHTRNTIPIHGGQSILVVQQQSTEYFLPTEVILEVCSYYAWRFARFRLFSSVIVYIVDVSDIIISCFCVCHSCADEIYAGYVEMLKELDI